MVYLANSAWFTIPGNTFMKCVDFAHGASGELAGAMRA